MGIGLGFGARATVRVRVRARARDAHLRDLSRALLRQAPPRGEADTVGDARAHHAHLVRGDMGEM